MSILFLLMIAGCGQTQVVTQQPDTVVESYTVPSRLVPEPDPEPTIRIVTDPLPVAARAGCPMDASVVIDVSEGPDHWTFSGTCVDSDADRSLIATCAHKWRVAKNPAIRVTHQKKDYVAMLLMADDVKDLAILSVPAELPAVELVTINPVVGDTVTSVGLSGEVVGERTSKITGVDLYDRMKNFETAGREFKGRSGGGLFFNGQFCGVIQSTRNDIDRSVYGGVDTVREMLAKSHAVAASGPVEIEFVTSPGHCPPCNFSSLSFSGRKNWRPGETITTADGRLRCTKVVGPRPWMTQDWVDDHPKTGYPMYRTIVNGQAEVFYGATTPDLLADEIEKKANPRPVSMSAGPVGATIQGAAVIESALSSLETWFGDGVEFSFRWIRKEAADALLINKTATRTEILGKSGRIEISTTSNRLPIHKIAFDYRFEGNKLFLKLDEIECDIPEEGAVGAAEPVGSPLMIAWTILSTIQTVYAIFHPTVDVWLGSEINATAKLVNHKLEIDCGPNPPAVRAHWAFFFKLIRFEYSRPLTNVTIAVPESMLGFHKSRTFRDVPIEVK